MKHILILSSLFILSCNNIDHEAHTDQNVSNAKQDSINRSALADTANYSELQWIDSIHQDLGKINQGQVVEIVWRLKNTGNKPLVIADVAPGCGCTLAEKPEEPIAPGQEGRIKAKYDSNNQSVGMQQKSVTVMANTAKNSYYLTFAVEVEAKK
jgi:hypothetical protein